MLPPLHSLHNQGQRREMKYSDGWLPVFINLCYHVINVMLSGLSPMNSLSFGKAGKFSAKLTHI